MNDVVAAIDCGTNSIRLLVAEHRDGRLVELDRRMLIIRLGEGVDATGELSPAALTRAFAACRQYRDVIDTYGAGAVRFAATSASRDARNAADFTAGVHDILGVLPEVITGDLEAELSFAGATAGLAHRTPVLVFDIGGGSTEFVLGSDRPHQAISVDMGCVRFHERFLRTDPADPVQVAAAIAAVDDLLDLVQRRVALDTASDVIGTAGTVTTVAALALGLPRYDAAAIHGARIPAAAVHDVRDRLLALPLARRRELPVMHPGRADVITSGAVILSRVLERTGAGELIASEHDILDGLARSLVN